jgi:hypothetical protein
MNRDILRELMLYLAQPGGVSKAAWDDAYALVCNVNTSDNAFIAVATSVLSRVARSRKALLPDPLHNMMAMWVADEQGDVWSIARNRNTKKNIESYLKMAAKLTSSKKATARG